ncbi:MAG TPA: hypothetical protein VI386_24660 [Candidatus Sulfotelmatobacter sp.]
MGRRLDICLLALSLTTTLTLAQAPTPSSSSSRHSHKPASTTASPLDPGAITNGLYHNSTLGFSCKIPAGWVLRSDEMNAHNGDDTATSNDAKTGIVLLAAFSRPPEAHAEDVNASILIAAESASAYPGLKDAAQYFGPLAEITKAQGFAEVEEPYEVAVGTKTLARADYQKDIGTRVMRQSTLVMLARGNVVSFTFIGGTEDEVEELAAGLSFQIARAKSKTSQKSPM